MTPPGGRTRAVLVLVRHGETEGNSRIRYHGRTDVALSDEGRAQMRAVRQALTGWRFDQVYSSAMARSREGARLIAPAAPAPIEIAELNEVDFGLFEGLTAEEIAQRYPDEHRRWLSDRLEPHYAYPGGESRAAFDIRVEAGLRRMLAHWRRERAIPEGVALLVAHRGVLRAITRALTGHAPIIELASIHVLEHDGSHWSAPVLDRTDHLDGDNRD